MTVTRPARSRPLRAASAAALSAALLSAAGLVAAGPAAAEGGGPATPQAEPVISTDTFNCEGTDPALHATVFVDDALPVQVVAGEVLPAHPVEVTAYFSDDFGTSPVFPSGTTQAQLVIDAGVYSAAPAATAELTEASAEVVDLGPIDSGPQGVDDLYVTGTDTMALFHAIPATLPTLTVPDLEAGTSMVLGITRQIGITLRTRATEADPWTDLSLTCTGVVARLATIPVVDHYTRAIPEPTGTPLTTLDLACTWANGGADAGSPTLAVRAELPDQVAPGQQVDVPVLFTASNEWLLSQYEAEAGWAEGWMRIFVESGWSHLISIKPRAAALEITTGGATRSGAIEVETPAFDVLSRDGDSPSSLTSQGTLSFTVPADAAVGDALQLALADGIGLDWWNQSIRNNYSTYNPLPSAWDCTSQAAQRVLGSITVVAATTATTVTGPATTSYGRRATLAVKVAGGGTVPTGTVAVTGKGFSQTVKLSGGSAAVSLPATLAAGAHTMTVRYGGDGTHTASSASHRLTVAKAAVTAPRLKVAKKPTSRATGRLAVVVAPVAGIKVPGRVKVVLTKGKRSKAVTGTLRNGRVTLTLPRLAKGTWRLRAAYLGSANLKTAKSRLVAVRVTR